MAWHGMAYHTIPWCTFTDLYHTIPYHTIPYHVQISHLMPVYLAVSTTAAYAPATTQGPKQVSRASTGRNYLFLRRADFSSDMADGKASLDPLRSVQFSSVHERPSRGFLWCAFTDLYHTIPYAHRQQQNAAGMVWLLGGRRREPPWGRGTGFTGSLVVYVYVLVPPFSSVLVVIYLPSVSSVSGGIYVFRFDISVIGK